MASGRNQVKQKPTKDFMMTRQGLRAPTPDSPSLSLASTGSSRGALQHLNGGHENAKELMLNHDYEDLEPQISASSRKNNSAIYPQSTPSNIPPAMDIKQDRQFSECWYDSSSSPIHMNHKDLWINKVILGLILAVSLTALVLVILVVVGVIGPKCGCNGKLVNTKHLEEVNQPNVSTSSLFKRINMLEKNISSLILQLKTLKYGGSGENETVDPSTSNLQQNLTTEVRALREKQVQLDTSLSNLKENDKTKTTDIQEINTRVIGLAVAVKFLSTNDSLIKSKVHSLSQAEVRFRSSLESLKRKDADLDTSLQRAKNVEASLNSSMNHLQFVDEKLKTKVDQINSTLMTSLESLKQKDAYLDTSLQRAKNVEAYLNSSMNQLQFVDEKLKTKVDQMNSTFLTKINNITGMIHAMHQLGGLPGPAGPQGPKGPPGSPGAGNLSQCKNVQNKVEGISGSNAIYSVLFKEPKDKIVVGATCSTIRGDETNLSSGRNSRGEKMYSCECKGESTVHNDSGNMKCFIDVWVCPRIS